MSKWWENSVGAAGQALYQDPTMALQVATLNDNLLKAQAQQQETKNQATSDSGGFMGWLSHTISSADGALSNVPGWGEAKKVGKVAWWPVDKTASGAHWLYSNAISQPIATAFLVSGQAEQKGYDQFLKGSTWSKQYGEAEHISPAQAYMNASAAEAATGKGIAVPSLMGTKFTKAESDQINRQYDRFAVDTDYWRNKVGWKYTAGTGALDFFFNVAGDPTAPVVGGVAGAVKGARSLQFVDDGAGLVRTRGAALDILSPKAPQTIGEAVASKNMNKFFDWSEGKSAAEIAAHPIWGRGRRVNPFANQYGQILSKAERDEMPVMLRFAAGDSSAAGQLSAKGTETLANLGKVSESRALVNSVRLNPDTAGYFVAREAGKTAEEATPLAKGRLLEAPFPRPTTPGPRQAGWDATYGQVEAQAGLARTAVREAGLKPPAAIRPASKNELKMANDWLTAKRALAESEVAAMQSKTGYYGSILGDNLGRSVEDFSPGEANLFGTMKQMYRMGPAALRDAEASAGRKIAAKTGAASDTRSGGLVTRTLRRGFYDTPKRVVQSFGDKLPEGRIDHNDIDAPTRVMEMLKRVPGLQSDQRISMLNDYTSAGDKVSRAKALETIQTNAILHMANRVHGLDPETSRLIAQMTKDGIDSTIAGLVGKSPTKQAFSSAVNPQTGRMVDKVDDDGAWILAPLAKTQLSATDTLLPVDEINTMLARHSGVLQAVKQAGGTSADALASFGDMFNNVWKASTLLRPGYVPRMISDELLLAAIKFGGMSRLVGDSVKGGQNFVRNRAQQVGAIAGKGSYVPSSGAGIESSHAIVKIADPDVAAAALARGDKVEKVRVNKALPLVRNVIDEEQEGLAQVNKDIAKFTVKRDRAIASDKSDLADVLSDKITLLEGKAADHQNVISEHVDYANEILRVAKLSTGKRLGESTFEAFGQKVPQAFSRDWENSIPRDQITSDGAFAAMVGRREAIHTGRAIKTGSWDYVTPDRPEHMQSWLDALNKQFRQDPVFKLVAGGDNSAANQWLRTPAGANHLRDLGIRGRDPKKLVQDIRHTLDKYLPEGTGLRAKMAQGEEITASDLRGAINKDDFPSVHGEEVKYLTGIFHKETAGHYVDEAIQKGFKWLGTLPSDILSRQPTYVHLQESRMKDLMAQEISYRKGAGKGTHLDADVLENIRNKSDKLARNDLKKIMYDPQQTSATQALRWVYPFLSAHTDGLARWGGMLAEDPKQITKIAKVYNAPVAANLVTDQQGNPVDMEGNVTVKDPETGKDVKKFVGLESRVLHLRMPWTAYKKGGNSAGTPISLSAINTILPGDPWFNPGSGPLVQVAGSELAKSNPNVGDFLQWSKVLPIGPTGLIESMTPKYMRSVYDAFTADDPNNVKYQQAYLSVYNKSVAEFHEGKIDKVDPKQVEKEAKNFMWIQALTAWGSPAQTQATPLTGTPYQFYVDQYKQMQQTDPAGAQDAFLSKYGADYFQFTSSMSKSMGISSTISAESQAQKYKDLIAADPDMASFIVGDVYNGGPFSSSVYQKQMDEMIGGQAVRSKTSAQDAINQNLVDLGWNKYMQAKGALDSTLIRAGFTSYTQKGAEGINEAKQKSTAYLISSNPEWGKAFSTTDRGIVPRRIQSFTQLVKDEKLSSDPMRQDIPALKEYLQMREQMKSILASRGLTQLSRDASGAPSGQAADIGAAWDQMTMSFINSNLSFAQLYNRYLSNDDLQ